MGGGGREGVSQDMYEKLPLNYPKYPLLSGALVDLDEEAHNELPHLDLQCLTSSLLQLG